jgi:hypothetical protein
MEIKNNTQALLQNDTFNKDLFNLFCGDLISTGSFRSVYQHKFDKTCVVKIDISGVFENISEYLTWNHVSNFPESMWFAPIEYVSQNGIILVQKKTSGIVYEKEYGVPSFFDDITPENFGIYKGRIVCHDYANCLFIEHVLNRKKGYRVEPIIFST